MSKKSIIVYFLSIIAVAVTAEWTIALEYSLNDFTNGYPLGVIEMRRSFDGNFTGTFKPTQESGFGKKLIDAQDGTYSVIAKSSTQPGQQFLSTNDPCLFLHSNLFHVFSASINQEKQQLNMLTVFPDTVAWQKDEESKYNSFGKTCKERVGELSIDNSGTPKGSVQIVGQSTLPSPDTASFVHRIEKEKRAKQHGADADNRSFLAKYWIYIVPVVIFAMISSAVNPEAGGEGQAAQ
uniref:ER membrane protein complex subunit 10 n=1 Tax=Caenorhabditis japonica TaxID=281687 RepID=A0A8R1DR40_CAEJA